MILAAWNIVVTLAFPLFLGAVIAGLLHGFVPPDFVSRHLRGRSGVLKAVALGVPLPLCSCGVLPAGLGLKRDGASDGASVGFLISTPQTGVDSILVSASFLGLPFALFKVFSAAVTGIVGGLLTDWAGSGSSEVDAPGSCSTEGADRSWRGMVAHGVDLLRMIWGWLVVGVLISAAIEVWVPPEVFAGLAAWGGLGSAFAALALSLPLYVCATASVPIAAALVAGGLPAGAALVFLMAGPATNAATVGAIARAFGRRTTAIYLGVLIVGSIGLGLAFDRVLGADAVAHAHEHGAASWEVALGGLLLVALAFFAIEDLVLRWRRRSATTPSTEPEVAVGVEGMSCGGCVQHLEKVLRSAEGVRAVAVTLEPGRAVVRGTVDRERVAELVVEAGYRPV